MSGKYYFIVELEAGVWLSDMEGDPGRTLKVENAKQFRSAIAASAALGKAQINYPNRPFKSARVRTVTP